MLHEFITANRTDLIRRCREKVAKRSGLTEASATTDRGVPLFLHQLAYTLRLEQSTLPREDSEPAPTPTVSDIGQAAALHGAELLRLGYSIDQVVHDYGDVCQAVTDLAVEQNLDISTDEFRTLNRCLDNAIADAVTAYGHGREGLNKGWSETLQDNLEYFSAEQERLVDIAIHAYSAIKTGNVGLNGATGALLLNALDELRFLGERILPETGLAPAAKKQV